MNSFEFFLTKEITGFYWLWLPLPFLCLPADATGS